METFTRETMAVAMESDGLEIRLEPAGEMTVGRFRLPAGTDLRPLVQGLEGDLCQCPHWGYMLKGTLRMHTATGPKEYRAGEAFYWAPGHAPEALDDVEYVDFSPSRELATVLEHVQRQAGGS
ncbi:MAG: hypothetical protein QOD86_1621 [Miltoncostaeaceae bacterium]|jgi:hypothetical protein|nr:hypothetical protein [Miltoncostaeaceae bacterium]